MCKALTFNCSLLNHYNIKYVLLGVVVFNQALADYQIPAPSTYACSGPFGGTGQWLSRQETADQYGRKIVPYYPAFTHWWVWYSKPYEPSVDYECVADNGIPYIPGVSTSPPYDGLSSPMTKFDSICYYQTPSGTVIIGQSGVYTNVDGTYGFTCTIASSFNPKSLGAARSATRFILLQATSP